MGAAACERDAYRASIADLADQFDRARRQPDPAAFEVASVSIAAQAKRAIAAKQVTRLTYHVTVPKGARLDVAAAVHPNVWDTAGAATLFIIGVSDGHWYQNKASFVIDPGKPGDRRWHDVAIDLEEFAGLTVDVVLNTRPAAAAIAGEPFVGVWGTPAVTRK